MTNVTCEAALHHLIFDSKAMAEHGTYLKMNPPADDTTETAIDQTKLAAFFEKDIRQKIAKIVQPLLPAPQAAESPYDSIVIEMLPSIDMDPLPGPDYATTALTWLAANWQNLGLMGFGLFAVVMLRSIGYIEE